MRHHAGPSNALAVVDAHGVDADVPAVGARLERVTVQRDVEVDDDPAVGGSRVAAVGVVGAHGCVGDAWRWAHPEGELEDDLRACGVDPSEVVEA